jgi:hypothetical protein
MFVLSTKTVAGRVCSVEYNAFPDIQEVLGRTNPLLSSDTTRNTYKTASPTILLPRERIYRVATKPQ